MKVHLDGHSVGGTWRALLIGTLLIPPNAYWVMALVDQGYPTTVSLFFNVIFWLFALTGLNMGIAKLTPYRGLAQGELLTVYVMLSVSSAIAGHDMLRVLIPSLPFAFWHANPHNEWADLFHRYIPDWLAVRDTNVMVDYYEGGGTLYDRGVLQAWARPALLWSAFIFALLFGMLCINSLVRAQWTEREKLTYPIIQLPLQMTHGGGVRGCLTSRTLWLGFAIAGVIDICNGVHHLVPSFPSIGGRLYDLGPLFTTKPWSAIGWTPVAVFPFAVGLAFFIPLDLSFSSWFFYLYWKAQRIAAAQLGVQSVPGFPFVSEQSYGAYVGLFVIVMFATRHHLGRVARKILTGAQDVDESREAMPYRAAALGLLASALGLTVFCRAAGMSLWVIVLFFILYYAASTAVTRLRAELGSPVHDLPTGPDAMLPRMFGTRALGPQNLTMFAFMFSFNRASRGHPMPHQLEGFKLAAVTGINNRRLLLGMIIAVALGSLSAFWAYLHIYYQSGVQGVHVWFPWQPFERLQAWMTDPRGPDVAAITATGVGFVTTLLLMVMRIRMFWWPLHPAGYAISSDWSMNVLWLSIFTSWLLKWIVLRAGGWGLYRKATPFFLGVVLGEFVVGSIWNLIGVAVQRPMYRFLF